MLKIRTIAHRIKNMNNNGNPEWSRVEQEATRGGTPFKNEIPGLIAFVKELSGGTKQTKQTQ